mgnify:FL=1
MWRSASRAIGAIAGTSALVVLSGCVPEPPSATSSMQQYLAGSEYLRGVNLYSLQQQRTLPVTEVKADTQESYEYFASRGMSVIRLAVPWQGLQPIAKGETPRTALARPVDQQYLDLVRKQVRYAENAGLRVIVDLHNGCTYPWGTGPEPEGTLYCGGGLTIDDVIKVWGALSDALRDEPGVAAYNLFNEPRKQTGAATYYRYVNAVVAELRDRGDDRAVWVDTILGSSFASDSQLTAPISDSAGAVIYSQHFYLHGGTRESLLSRIRDFGEWCKNRAVHCAIGEIGWPAGGSSDKSTTFELAYGLADHYGMDVTYFGATSVPNPQSLIAYYATSDDSTVDARRDQARIVEKHPTR